MGACTALLANNVSIAHGNGTAHSAARRLRHRRGPLRISQARPPTLLGCRPPQAGVGLSWGFIAAVVLAILLTSAAAILLFHPEAPAIRCARSANFVHGGLIFVCFELCLARVFLLIVYVFKSLQMSGPP